MQIVEVKTLQEAARIMPMLGIIRIALAVSQGATVEVLDESKDIKYVFKPSKRNEVRKE